MLTCSVLPAWMTQGSSSPSLTPSLLKSPFLALCLPLCLRCPFGLLFVLFLLGPPLQGCSGSVTLGETWKRCDLPVPALHVKGDFFPQPELTPCISCPSAVCPEVNHCTSLRLVSLPRTARQAGLSAELRGWIGSLNPPPCMSRPLRVLPRHWSSERSPPSVHCPCGNQQS